MNLQRLLAENMIRFNTKNLNENQIRKLLKEQLTINTSPKGTGALGRFAADPKSWGPNFTSLVATTKGMLTKAGIKFTYMDNDTAAIWVGLAGMGSSNVNFKPWQGVGNALQNSIESYSDYGNKWTSTNVVQCNISPDDPTKILTAGIITATTKTGDELGESSLPADVVQYMNDYNMGLIPDILCTGKAPNQTITISAETIEPGDPKTTPGAGSLYVEADGYDYTFYSQQKFTAAAAGTEVKTSTETVWTPGPETKADLPKNLFPVLSVKLDAAVSPAITKAIEDAKKLGQITSVRIESGASFDEPVKLDNAGFAAKLGLQPNQVPADPTKDAEGVVKDPMSGGNAFLAYQRAQAMLNAIGNTAGVTPTVVATVAKGGDAARYARLVFGIKKPDQSTTTTKEDIANIGVGSSTENVAGKFQIFVYYA